MKILETILADVAGRAEVQDQIRAESFESALQAIDAIQRSVTRGRSAVNESDHLALRRDLLAIAAKACRALRDLGLATEAEAVKLDDAELHRR